MSELGSSFLTRPRLIFLRDKYLYIFPSYKLNFEKKTLNYGRYMSKHLCWKSLGTRHCDLSVWLPMTPSYLVVVREYDL